MTGDSLFIWDDERGFFAGWEYSTKIYVNDKPTAKWSKTVNGAKKSRALGYMHTTAKRLGGSACVVSETKARSLEAIRYYGDAARKIGVT